MYYIYFILFYFILLFNYALILWVFMFLGYMVCLTYVLGDGIAIIYFYFILFIQLYIDVMGNYGFEVMWCI